MVDNALEDRLVYAATQPEFCTLKKANGANDNYMSLFDVLPDYIITDTLPNHVVTSRDDIKGSSMPKEDQKETLMKHMKANQTTWHHGTRMYAKNFVYMESIESNDDDWFRIVPKETTIEIHVKYGSKRPNAHTSIIRIFKVDLSEDENKELCDVAEGTVADANGSICKDYRMGAGGWGKKATGKKNNEEYCQSHNQQGGALDIVYNKVCGVLSDTVDAISKIFAGMTNPPGWGRKCRRSDYRFKSMVTTVNFFNECHTDLDTTKSISMWYYTNGNKESYENGYFLFPDLRMDGSGKALAIKLEHGSVIEWDGRILRHCTAVPIFCQNSSNRLCATFTAGI